MVDALRMEVHPAVLHTDLLINYVRRFTMNCLKLRILARLALYVLIVFSGLNAPAKAQESPTVVPNSSAPAITVVTLYSVSQMANVPVTGSDKLSHPPIQIVNGGVKSGGASCWQLNDRGEITNMPGDCYVLRSAKRGEQMPSPESANAAEH